MNLQLKNADLLNVQQEINSLLSSKIKIRLDDGSILEQPVVKSLKLKFYLIDLLQKTTDLLKPFNSLKDELIKEKGTPIENGGFKLNQFKEGADLNAITENDLTDEFKDYLELANQTVDITFASIPVELFEAVETENVYPTLLKFVKL